MRADEIGMRTGRQGVGAVPAPRWDREEARIRDAYGRRTDAARYSWFNRAHLLATHRLEEAVLAALSRCGVEQLASVAILDVGCGSGGWLREFIKWGADPHRVAGVDLLAQRIEDARRLCPAGVTLRCESAASLEVRSHSFDVVFQSMLFSSVLDDGLRRAIACEMVRVLRPAGVIVWYDFHVNNPRNPDVRGVSRREIRELFPGCAVDFQRLTLAAPVARWIAPRSRMAWAVLTAIPWLRTHTLAIIRKAH